MPVDVCGPFTLEQLDLFGDIDSIPFSFDSEIWLSADTCVLYQEGEISAVGNVTAAARQLPPVTVNGAIFATGEVTAVAGFDTAANGAIFAVGKVTTRANANFSAFGQVAAAGTVAANLYRFGEEWTVIPAGVNIWTPAASSAGA